MKQKYMKTNDEQYSSINNLELWDELLPKSELRRDFKINLDELKKKSK